MYCVCAGGSVALCDVTRENGGEIPSSTSPCPCLSLPQPMPGCELCTIMCSGVGSMGAPGAGTPLLFFCKSQHMCEYL